MNLHRLVSYVSLLACLSACGITVPASDHTPPNLELRYRVGERGDSELVPAEGLTLPVEPGQTIYLEAVARDRGGVMGITLDGVGEFTCEPGGGSVTVTVHDDSIRPAAVGAHTDSSRGLELAVEVPDICSSGALDGSMDIHARAENYHGGEAAPLTLRLVAE